MTWWRNVRNAASSDVKQTRSRCTNAIRIAPTVSSFPNDLCHLSQTRTFAKGNLVTNARRMARDLDSDPESLLRVCQQTHRRSHEVAPQQRMHRLDRSPLLHAMTLSVHMPVGVRNAYHSCRVNRHTHSQHRATQRIPAGTPTRRGSSRTPHAPQLPSASTPRLALTFHPAPACTPPRLLESHPAHRGHSAPPHLLHSLGDPPHEAHRLV